MRRFHFRAAPTWAAAFPALTASAACFAQVADQAGAGIPTIVITSQHLNEERSRIDTQTGADCMAVESKV